MDFSVDGKEEGAGAGTNLLQELGPRRFAAVLADPPWRFANRTGKMAPEHRRLTRYSTMTPEEIKALPVYKILQSTAHLYLWVPNALLPLGLSVMECWGFTYKTNVIWYKIRKDGGPDRRGVGFYPQRQGVAGQPLLAGESKIPVRARVASQPLLAGGKELEAIRT